MKEYKFKDFAAFKIFINSKMSNSKKDKEKLMAVRLLLEKSNH